MIGLSEQGVKKVAGVTPGFMSDCVETLEEIGIALHEDFATAGGTHFSTVPCLNASALSQNLLQIIAERELSGWTH